MHYLITGHTGFKGAWLSLLLKSRGHEVSGVSVKSEKNSLYATAHVGELLKNDIQCDVRDRKALTPIFLKVNPDVVIHLAAQSLVRRSFVVPLETFETNVNGTLNVLSASDLVPNLKAQLIITTDKVYKNNVETLGYIETDSLGGSDPYSASKAMADIATQVWMSRVSRVPTAIARAGNVFGGGDWSEDRLIPDLIRSLSNNQKLELRFPNAIRPWQHILDCLNGYLLLIERTLNSGESGIWNFGPNPNVRSTVIDIAEIVSKSWGAEFNWALTKEVQPVENACLLLNSDKARQWLGWKDRLTLTEGIEWTSKWYRRVHDGSDPLEETLRNISDFEARKE